MIRNADVYYVFRLVVVSLSCCLTDGHGSIYTQCGSIYNETRGVIHTPNFPGPYPFPIYCEWLIKAPPGRKTVLYFTQYYMMDSFNVSEYDYFQDITTYIGREDLGQILDEHDIAFLVSYKPYVLIQFSVSTLSNRHLRVIDHLLDVYGFNITYEIIDATANVSKKTCTAKMCSYLGNCIVSGDYMNYECRCFDSFFGEQCQYGPFCNPDKNINQCLNGGLCQYFFGSLINQCECPDGFEGSYCEIPTSDKYAQGNKDCHQCSQECELSDDGTARCYCYDGYTLDNDVKTCHAIARVRYDVSLEFHNFISVSDRDLKETLTSFGTMILETIQLNGVPSASKSGMKGLRNTSTNSVLDFHFYCLVSEAQAVQGALKTVTDLHYLAGYALKDTMPHFDKNPELALLSVANYDKDPIPRGKLLTLVCTVKGSKGIVFHWYKDKKRIDTSLTHRNVWESLIPDNLRGIQLSVLNIDNVLPIDQGVFTCVVTDFGESRNGSVEVIVTNNPSVQLDPISFSVVKGQTLSIKCLSPDDSWVKFVYEWFKNGEKIDADSKTEYGEKLRPTGNRLVVHSVSEYAEYTCRITNEAGSANATAYVFAISGNETNKFCSSNTFGHVTWSMTYGHHFNVQRCPVEEGGEFTRRPMEFGYAQRNCKCHAQECSWDKPNFSKCQSLILMNIYDEMELIENGYQQTTLTGVFDKLYNFTLLHTNITLYSGDIDMVADILKSLFTHMNNFPQLVKLDKRIHANRLMDLLSVIVRRSSMATPDEKLEIMIGPHIILIADRLISGALQYLNYSLNMSLTTDVLDLQRQKLPIVIKNNTKLLSTGVVVGNTVEGIIDMVTVYLIRFSYLAELLAYKDQKGRKADRVHFYPASRVYSVAQVDEYPTFLRNPVVTLPIYHLQQEMVTSNNTTICLRWLFDHRKVNVGQWSQDGCITKHSYSDRTDCECTLPGHFVVAVIPSIETNMQMKTDTELVYLTLMVGYSLSLLCMMCSGALSLIKCRKLKDDIIFVRVSFVASIAFSTFVTWGCLIWQQAPQPVRDIAQLLLAFFIYVSYTAINLEAFRVFLFTYNVKIITMTKMKFIISCWGVPLLLLIPVFVTSNLFRDTHACNKLLWYDSGSNDFVANILILGLLAFTYFILLTLCLRSLKKWNDSQRREEKNIHLSLLANTGSFCLLITLSTSTRINLHESSSHTIQIIFHMIFHTILCIAVLLICSCLTMQIPRSRICCGKRKQNSHLVKVKFLCRKICSRQSKSDSHLVKGQYNICEYRAFIKPEMVTKGS